MRAPRPLPRRARIAVVVASLALLVGAAIVLQRAQAADGGRFAGDEWIDEPQPPRSGRVDDFERSGSLDPPTDFGPWQVASGSFAAADGVVVSTGPADNVATVDVGAADVAVFVRVVRADAGSGVVLGRTSEGERLDLVASDRPGRWVLRFGGTVIVGFDAPTERVTVEVVRRASTISVEFDGGPASDASLPDGIEVAEVVGMVGRGRGLAVDLFAYLPLE